MHFEHHIENNTNHQAGHINYAILLASLDRHIDAIEVLNRTIKITNGQRKGKALSLLGMSLLELSAFSEAEAAFDKSIQYRPTHGPTWRRLAFSRSKLSSFSEADVISTYVRSDAVSPGNARTKGDLANYLFSVGRFDDALEHYRDATKLAPSKASYAIERSVNLIASERPSAARKVLKKAKAIKLSASSERQTKKIDAFLNGNNAKVLKLLSSKASADETELDGFLTALLFLEVGDFENAVGKLSKLPPNGTYFEPGTFLLAKYLYRAGRLDEAEKLLTQLTAAGTQSPIYLLYLGRTKTAQHEFEAAFEAHRRAYELYPESGRVTIEYAGALRKIGQSDTATSVLLTYLEESPKDSRALIALAEAYDSDGNFDRAEQIYKLVFDQQSENAATAKKLANVQLRAGRVSGALTTLERVIEQHPSEIDARLLRAKALSELGRHSDAVIEYQRVLKLDANNEAAQSALDQIAG